MTKKTKPILVLILLSLQFFQNKYFSSSWFSIDFSFLIVIFVALKSSVFKTGLTATLIGLMNDFLSGGVLGVFGFSRTLIAFVFRGILTFIDLRKGFYVFLITAVALFFSNLTANFLLFLIYDFPFNISFILFQPIFTGMTAFFILKNKFLMTKLDVY